jgi:uncharacterized secreted protein with C-terminal beta-propeller domain
MINQHRKELFYGFAIVVVVGLVSFGLAVWSGGDAERSNPLSSEESFTRFEDEGEMRAFVAETGGSANYRQRVTTSAFTQDVASESGAAGESSGSQPSRHSRTNVQVRGVQEPDVVKTDGESIFYTRNQYGSMNLTVLDAFPLDDLNVSTTLQGGDNLFLDNNTLVILEDSRVRGFNVSTPSQPETMWSQSFNGSIVSARLQHGDLFFITRDRVDYDNPCPIHPVGNTVIPCNRIYHPRDPVNAETTYSIVKADLGSGRIVDATSFLGSRSNTVVSVSEDNIYVTYEERTPRYERLKDFLEGAANDLLDNSTRRRLERLSEYNISDRAKEVELETIIDDWQTRLNEDARLEVENELESLRRNWTKRNMRRYQSTGIARISVDSLEVEAQGRVPGSLNDQFSLDEREGTVRVATTVDPSFGRADSENDVYTLSVDSLTQQGNVTGMGVNERIYSVRFLDDKGYVVTFRRVDPFHVLDLSDPENPSLEGELKLPGFSSYLHPLGNNTVLGVGEEDGEVKAVVFNVSDPSNPVVKDSYILDESWSAIRNTHHAFLHDERHDVFFLPASQGGYVFSYDDGLSLEKAVSMKDVERAVYINDYLYVLGLEEITVLDEETWDRVASISLGELSDRIIDYPVEPIRRIE